MDTLDGAWKTNLNVRPEKDWEKLEGRAVVEKTLKTTKLIAIFHFLSSN